MNEEKVSIRIKNSGEDENGYYSLVVITDSLGCATQKLVRGKSAAAVKRKLRIIENELNGVKPICRGKNEDAVNTMLVSPAKAARILGFTRNQVRECIEAELIPAFTYGGQCYVLVSGLQSFVESCVYKNLDSIIEQKGVNKK